MAEAKNKVNSKQQTTDSKKAEKPSTTSRKPSAKANPKETTDGIDQKNSQNTTTTTKKEEVVVKAKAGKRSEKALKETEAKLAKEARKTESIDKQKDNKQVISHNPPRTLLERKGKKFRRLAEQLEPGKTYTLQEAINLASKTSPTKFDATVEMHIRLGVDPRQADQNIRDTIVLPAGNGKTSRVTVFAEPADVAKAKTAGADNALSEEFLQQLEKGIIDFEVLVTTPAMMPKLGKYARLLGPKGLMPNPKSGTVTSDVSKAVKEAKAGRIEYRVDSTGIVHVGIGKVSFGADKLLQNAKAMMESIKHNKPASLKSVYVKSIYLTTSMGPSMQVETTEA